jgi:hypothetical protein
MHKLFHHETLLSCDAKSNNIITIGFDFVIFPFLAIIVIVHEKHRRQT